jgi:hypothetical protein
MDELRRAAANAIVLQFVNSWFNTPVSSRNSTAAVIVVDACNGVLAVAIADGQVGLGLLSVFGAYTLTFTLS